jgi:hypothetical protein
MRGWGSIVVSFVLLGVAVWAFSASGFGSATLICGVAAAFFLIRGAQGLAVGEAGDPTALVDFVSDPAGAIVDTATDRIGDWLKDDSSKAATEQPEFDADAAIARYLAQREPQPAAASASTSPARGFGRKGT